MQASYPYRGARGVSIGSFFRRLFGPPTPPPPVDRRAWNEDWRAGDLAECLVPYWTPFVPDGAPKMNEIRRVRFTREGPTIDNKFLVIGLVFDGSDYGYCCTCFRKLRQTIEPAEEEFTTYIRTLTGEPQKAPAKGIVTATADETQSGSVERSEIEPGAVGIRPDTPA